MFINKPAFTVFAGLYDRIVSMKNVKFKVKGFTLIELLVIISIVGFLSSVITSSVADARVNATDAKYILGDRELMKAIEQYRAVNNELPGTFSENDIILRNGRSSTKIVGACRHIVTNGSVSVRFDQYFEDLTPFLVPDFFSSAPDIPEDECTLVAFNDFAHFTPAFPQYEYVIIREVSTPSLSNCSWGSKIYHCTGLPR